MQEASLEVQLVGVSDFQGCEARRSEAATPVAAPAFRFPTWALALHLLRRLRRMLQCSCPSPCSRVCHHSKVCPLFHLEVVTTPGTEGIPGLGLTVAAEPRRRSRSPRRTSQRTPSRHRHHRRDSRRRSCTPARRRSVTSKPRSTRSRPRSSAHGRGQAHHRRHSHRRRSPSRRTSRRPVRSRQALLERARSVSVQQEPVQRAPSDSPPRAPMVLVSGPGMIGDRPSDAFGSGQAAQQQQQPPPPPPKHSWPVSAPANRTSAPVRGHAREVVSLFVRHPHRRFCHDSGLRQPTIHQLLQLHIFMADKKLITKAGRTPEPASATSRTIRTGSRLMLSKNEFAHCPLTWPNVMSCRSASTNPSPASRRPCARNLLICFWHRELQPVLWKLQHIMRFQVADLWDCICFPLATPGVPAFGVEEGQPQDNTHRYVSVHGTDIPAGTSILHELLIRPHMPGARNEGSFPAYCFYGQCALGDLDLHNLKQAVDRQLRISRGFQGILIAGIVRTAQVHAKINWSDTTEEAHLKYRRGVVRTPTRWAFTRHMPTSTQ